MNKKPIFIVFGIVFVFYLTDVYYSYLTMGQQAQQYSSLFNPTEIVRGLGLMLLIIFFLQSDYTKEKKYIFLFSVFYIFSYLVTMALFGPGIAFYSSNIFRYFSPLLKTLFSMLLPFLVFMYLTKHNIDEVTFFNYSRYFLFFLYIAPIFLSWLGIAGYYSYGYTLQDLFQVRYGYKGFIYGPNGLTATAIMIMLLFTYVNTPVTVIILIASIGGGILIGTKGFIIIGSICIIFNFLLDIKESLRGTNKAKLALNIILFVTVLSLSVYYFRFALEQTYLYAQGQGLERGDAFMAISSGRFQYFYAFIDQYPKLSMLQLVFGGMALWMAEVDLFYQLDLFGFIGLFIYFFMIFYLLKSAYIMLKFGKMHRALALSTIGLLMHSLTGGHVYCNPPTMTPAALVIGLLLYCRHKSAIA